MTSEREIAKKITTYLDRGAAELKSGTAYRLQAARRAALAALAEPERATDLALAGAGHAGSSGKRHILADARVWIGVLLIVGAALYFQYWQSVQQVRDIEETDAAILTSDLPIEAYLDRGFPAWLKHSTDN
jgi:nicotinamide mononucleotide (NMN) deamidase PncC